MLPSPLLAALLAALVVLPTHAHVSITPPTAVRNSYAVVAARVPHGCDGSATTEVTVIVPNGVTSVKPQMVPGWQVEITMRALNPPITSHGKSINETVDRVRWHSGPPLPDSLFMDFGLQIKTPDAVTRLVWPIVQKCQVGETAWVQVPTTPDEALPYPAPGLSITEPPAATASAVSASATASATSAAAQAQKTSGVTAVAAGYAAPAAALLGAAAVAFA